MTPSISQTAEGESLETALSTDAYIIGYNRAVNLFGNIYYDKEISDNQRLYTQLKYDFERRESHGTNQTFFYQNFSAYAHYILSNRYIADVSLVASAHNFFAPEHKWGFSPTVGLAWIISNEDFLSQSESIDYFKLRATFGRIHSGNTPSNGYWEQTYKGGPSYYCFDTAYTNPGGTTMPNRMATSDDSTHEMADKFNVGIDARTGNTVKVNVKNKNGDIVWQKEIKLNINEAADIAFDVQYQKSGRWKGALKVTNNKNSKDLSGEFKISEPQIISEYTPVVKIENIPPNSTRIVEFSIPLEASRDFIELKGEVVFESGERKEINESSYFTALTPVRSTPKIDGVIEKGEYNAEAPMRFNKSRMVIMPADARWTWNWNGLNDLSAVGYINYDKEFFYLAYEVTDDILGDKDAKKRIWANMVTHFLKKINMI
jgi:hypothetical protein